MTSAKMVGAGEMRERPYVMKLVATESGMEWQPQRRTWAMAELSTRKNIWSVHGIGSTGVSFVMRRQDLEMENALRWHNQHCFITSITPCGYGHIKVEAAIVEIVQCENKYEGLSFPAIMTEEYHRHEQLEPYAINTLRHVLVTPKCIKLQPGKLIRIEKVDWPILTAHTLDPYKNEYIIERTVDL